MTWIYQNQHKSALDAITEMVIPPASELIALYQAVQRCDIANIQLAANSIKQLDTQYTAFADKLLVLADEFEIEAIASLLEPHIS